jgi:hypothetical protein
MGSKSRVIQYPEPRIYWAFEAITASVYRVVVVAESDHFLWLKPVKEFDRNGRPHRPVQKRKAGLPTFYSFHDAKNELMNVLDLKVRAANKQAAALASLYQQSCRIPCPASGRGVSL